MRGAGSGAGPTLAKEKHGNIGNSFYSVLPGVRAAV